MSDPEEGTVKMKDKSTVMNLTFPFKKEGEYQMIVMNDNNEL